MQNISIVKLNLFVKGTQEKNETLPLSIDKPFLYKVD